MERLQKRIASCGITSRRKAEALIKEGKVKVNGKIITEMGFIVDKKDCIEINDIKLETSDKQYYVINKPRGIISTVSDNLSRKTVIDILPNELKKERLFPVGRLDRDTKGVLLITNDGEFMNLLVGPKSGIEKEYLVRVEGIVNNKKLKALETGLVIDDYKYLPALYKIESTDLEHNSSLVRIIITQGKYHQVKEMFKFLGFPVKHMTRTRFGCIKLEDLPEGTCRKLTIHEVKTLIELSKKDKLLVKEDLSRLRKY